MLGGVGWFGVWDARMLQSSANLHVEISGQGAEKEQ